MYHYTIYDVDGTITRTRTTKKLDIIAIGKMIGGYVEILPRHGYYDPKKMPGTLYARSNGVAEGCSRNPHFPGHPHYGVVGPVIRVATDKQEARLPQPMEAEGAF